MIWRLEIRLTQLRAVDSKGRVSAGVLAIRTLRRVSSILPLTRRFTDTSTAFLVFLALSIMLTVVDETVHTVLTPHFVHIIVQAEAGTAAGTATLAFVVAGEGIPACELAAAFWARVWTLAGVQLGMTFQVVQTAKPGLAGRAFVWLFLAVCQQVALEVVVPCEVGRAVGAFVTLGGGRFGTVLVAGQAHLTRRSAGIVLRREGSRKGKGTVPRIFAWIRGNGLVLHLWSEGWLLIVLLR